ncbi:MAG: SOS response-associated peptidase family protein [Planctomycetaceae bacterium]|nr:SOS response-associated peptidase family protein [Planctomycetaceae bacterium]
MTLNGGRLFAFAGLWERWEKGVTPIESCTILTTDANDDMQPIHDRNLFRAAKFALLLREPRNGGRRGREFPFFHPHPPMLVQTAAEPMTDAPAAVLLDRVQTQRPKVFEQIAIEFKVFRQRGCMLARHSLNW